MTDVLIAGGGLAGSAAATLLARDGRSVRLLERNTGPKDKMCGEFLSIEAQHHLAALGIDLAAMGAMPVGRIRLVSRGQTVEADLPFIAQGISRRRLDEALLTLAIAAGAEVERGARVMEVSPHGVRTQRGEHGAHAVLLATGKLPVRQRDRPDDAMVEDGHVGFKMHWRASARVIERLAGHIELVLFRGGYAGIQMVDARTANLCLVIRRGAFAALGGRWSDILAAVGLLSPTLSALVDSEPLFDKPLTVANLDYGRLPRTGGDDPVFRLGDQAAMTASLTGDGMAIALRSAWLAAQCLRSGQSAPDYHRRLAAMVGPQVRRGMWLQSGAERPLLRQICLGLLRMRPGLLKTAIAVTRLPDISLSDPAPPLMAAPDLALPNIARNAS